jgi:hypothetical protein
MPIAAAVVPALIGGAASLYAGSQANKGIQRGIDAQQQATQQSLDLQRQQFDQTRQDQAPFRQGGLAGLDAILADYGLGNQGPQAGQPDYGAYVTGNPDIAAEAQRVLASNPNAIGDLNQDGRVDATDYGQYHAQTFGDRPVPTAQGAATAPQTAEQRLQEQVGERPTFAPREEYNRPGYVAPDVSINAFQASPDYNFRLQEGSRNLNAFNAAKGVTGSGAAAKALVGYGQNLAGAEYGDFVDRTLGMTDRQNAYNQGSFESDRQYGTGVYDADRNFGTGNFQSDRTYATDRADTRTNDLFRLTGIGQGATQATNQAGQNYANNAQDQLNTNANVLGNAYGQIGQNQAGLAGQLSGYAQNIFTNWQKKPAGGNAGTSWSQSWGGGS